VPVSGLKPGPDPLVGATFGFLGLPYLLFFWGWLRLPYAIVATVVLCASFVLTVRRLRAEASSPGAVDRGRRGVGIRHLAVLALCAVWVALSGAGGVGYQNDDYAAHNGRLLDLVAHPWPLVYPGSRALVYYSAYYLPCALLGKLAGVAVASRVMYLWTLTGVVLTACWILRISRGRVWAVALFMLFSGLDVLGYALLGWDARLSSWEWWSFREVYLAYQSTTFQLFWAPHQVTAAWLLTLTLFWISVERRDRGGAIFLVALGCLWTPFATLGLLPFLAASILSTAPARWRRLLSFANLAGGGMLVILIGLYYVGGSLTVNPRGWLWEKVPLGDWRNLMRLGVFYMLEFGVLFLLLARRWSAFDAPRRLWFAALGLVLCFSPLYVYGMWNDLHARGVVPSLLVLFLFVVEALSGVSATEMLAKRRFAAVGLVLALAVGALTPLRWFAASIQRFGQARRAVSAIDTPLGSQTLGSTDSLFFRYLARGTPGEAR